MSLFEETYKFSETNCEMKGKSFCPVNQSFPFAGSWEPILSSRVVKIFYEYED